MLVYIEGHEVRDKSIPQSPYLLPFEFQVIAMRRYTVYNCTNKPKQKKGENYNNK